MSRVRDYARAEKGASSLTDKERESRIIVGLDFVIDRVRVKARAIRSRFVRASRSPQLAAPVCARATSDGKQEGTGRKKTSERVRGGNLEAVSAPVSRRVIYTRIGDSGFADPMDRISRFPPRNESGTDDTYTDRATARAFGRAATIRTPFYMLRVVLVDTRTREIVPDSSRVRFFNERSLEPREMSSFRVSCFGLQRRGRGSAGAKKMDA